MTPSILGRQNDRAPGEYSGKSGAATVIVYMLAIISYDDESMDSLVSHCPHHSARQPQHSTTGKIINDPLTPHPRWRGIPPGRPHNPSTASTLPSARRNTSVVGTLGRTSGKYVPPTSGTG